MELVERLREWRKMGTTLRLNVKLIPPSTSEKWNKPLATQSPEDVAKILLTWASERAHLRHTFTIQIRLTEVRRGVMYYVGVRTGDKYKAGIEYVHEVPYKPMHKLYVWKPMTTHHNLTKQEPRDSVVRADELQRLTEQSEMQAQELS